MTFADDKGLAGSSKRDAEATAGAYGPKARIKKDDVDAAFGKPVPKKF